MNTRQKVSLWSGILLAAASLALWGATGFSLFTRQQIPVRQTDDLLGTTYIVWKDVFMVGLDLALPIAVAALVLGAGIAYLLRTKHP